MAAHCFPHRGYISHRKLGALYAGRSQCVDFLILYSIFISGGRVGGGGVVSKNKRSRSMRV
jgi:hypothetical protein